MNAEIALGPTPIVCGHEDVPTVRIYVEGATKRVCLSCLPKYAAKAVDEKRQIRTAR